MVKILEIQNSDGDVIGLFTFPNSKYTTVNDLNLIVKEAFAVAEARDQHYKENDYEEEINIFDEAVEYLGNKGFVYVQPISIVTDKL